MLNAMALIGAILLVLQIDFMYDSMKEAKAKMAAMRRELEVSREVQEKLTVQNCALQRAVNALVRSARCLPSASKTSIACTTDPLQTECPCIITIY